MTSPYDPFICPCGRCKAAAVETPLTGIEQAALQPIKDRPVSWQDRKAPTNVVDELDRLIVEWMAGEVRADD